MIPRHTVKNINNPLNNKKVVVFELQSFTTHATPAINKINPPLEIKIKKTQ